MAELFVASGKAQASPSATAVAGSGDRPSDLKRRVLRLLVPPPAGGVRGGPTGIVLLLVLALGLLTPAIARLNVDSPGVDADREIEADEVDSGAPPSDSPGLSDGKLNPHPDDLEGYQGFLRFTVTVDGKAIGPDDLRGRRMIAPLARGLTDEQIEQQNHLAAAIIRDPGFGSLEEAERHQGAIIAQGRKLHATYNAALMFNHMMTVHEWGTSPQHNRVKSRFALAGLEYGEQISIGLRFRLLEQGSFSALNTEQFDDPSWSKARHRYSSLWLKTLTTIREAIDPDWDKDDYPQLNIAPPGGGFRAGITPEDVKDPKTRREYVRLIDLNRLKAERYRQQKSLRDLEKLAQRNVGRFLIRFYSRPPARVGELQKLLKRDSSDKRWNARLLATLTRIFQILPDGERSRFALQGAFGDSGRAGMPRVLDLLEDRDCVAFAREEAITGLAILSDNAKNVDPDSVPRAVRILKEIAADRHESKKLREYAVAWLSRYQEILNRQRPPKKPGDELEQQLRPRARAAFESADYEQMAAAYRLLARSPKGTLDDALWCAHALHLDGRWEEARDAFHEAMRKVDAEFARLDREIKEAAEDKGDDDVERPSTGPGKEGRIALFERHKEQLRETWPMLVLATGQIELLQLDDPDAAVETLSQGLRFAPTGARTLTNLAADAARAVAGEKLDPNHQHFRELLYPIATQRYLAMAYDRLALVPEAADAWCRVRLCSMAYKVGLANVEREHLLALLKKLPDERRRPYHDFVEKNAGRFTHRTPRPVKWQSAMPDGEPTPFSPIMLDGMQFTILGPSHSGIARLDDGQFLLAYTSGDWQQHRIMFSASQDDGRTWQTPWEFPHNGVFDTRAASVAVDEDGVIWMVYTSKSTDINRYNSGGYRLWLCSSLDGHDWSKPRVIQTPQLAQYQQIAQLTRDNKGQFWVFHNGAAGHGESPEDISRLDQIPFPESEARFASNMHAVFDEDGVCHVVFDDFGRATFYSQSVDGETWLKPEQIDVRAKNTSVEFPQLVQRDGRAVLLYQTRGGLWMRRTRLDRNRTPHFDKAVRIIDYRLGVRGSRVFVSDDRVLLPAGGSYTPALLSASIDELLK